jgi:hypothetical protein
MSALVAAVLWSIGIVLSWIWPARSIANLQVEEAT